MSPTGKEAESSARYARLDALRGAAILWMVLFHLCFDLNHFGLLSPRQNFYADPFWTWQRTAIVSGFVAIAGLSLACALHSGQGWPRFWRRWAQVVGCAALVSLGSWLVFPNSWISFGVLHAMALMLVLARLLAPWRAGVWLLAALALALPWLVQHPVFDNRWLNPIGLVTRKPITEDYVPLLPWLGVLLLGLAAGQRWLEAGAAWLQAPLPGWAAGLAWAGRWPLAIYMLHQPVLFGLLYALTMAR
jgi:uncharacterized membrane protein